MTTPKRKSASLSQAKISETFLKFAEPLTDALGEGITKEQLEQILKIAFTVWNAVVFDTVAGNNDFVSQLRSLSSGDPVAATIEQMIRRKRKAFADDLRLIGNYKLTWTNGEWRLWAEARAPTP